jgi:gas vesicle protein
MSKQNISNQSKQITQFVQHLNNKNYSEANKSLQKTIESKLINKISQYKNINIFKQ